MAAGVGGGAAAAKSVLPPAVLSDPASTVPVPKGSGGTMVGAAETSKLLSPFVSLGEAQTPCAACPLRGVRCPAAGDAMTDLGPGTGDGIEDGQALEAVAGVGVWACVLGPTTEGVSEGTGDTVEAVAETLTALVVVEATATCTGIANGGTAAAPLAPTGIATMLVLGCCCGGSCCDCCIAC